MSRLKLAWIAPKTAMGGIRDYSLGLWPALETALKRAEGEGRYWPLEGFRADGENFDPAVIHIQHEYGEFGRKLPGLYRFPEFVRKLKSRWPRAKIVATGHTVLPPGYRLPTEGRGLQAPLRAVANRLLLPHLHQIWGPRTWGVLDGVVVHSALQSEWVKDAGCRRVEVIPHYVEPVRDLPAPDAKGLIVFGFISPEKGQHLAIQALEFLPETRLIIAGGIRRPADAAYERHCRALAAKFPGRVEFLGYLSASKVDEVYARARLAVAPFTETLGSGSLTQALRRGVPLLASDLPLNAELLGRMPGVLALFRTSDALDLAIQAGRLLKEPLSLAELSQKGKAYAESYSAAHVADLHIQFYRGVT